MIHLTSSQRIILRDLFNASGKLDVFTLYKRYGFLPDQLFYFVKRFVRDGIVNIQGSSLNLTEKGKNWILQRSTNISFSSDAKPWNKIPPSFMGNRIEPNEPYIPSICHLSDLSFPKSKEFYKNNAKSSSKK